VFRKNYDN